MTAGSSWPAPATARVGEASPRSDSHDAAAAVELIRRLRRADRVRAALAVGALVVALVALGVTALAVGAVPLTPAEVVGGLIGDDPGASFIVTGLRLPRLVLAAAVGAALGLSGALLQAVVRNPLASPDIVGLTGGASAAAVLAISAGLSGTAVDGAALAGASGAAALVFALAGRGIEGTRFVVVGVAVAFAAQGVLGYALTRASLTQARSAFFWLVGSVGTSPWSDVALVAAGLLVVGAALVLLRGPLRTALLDGGTARVLGGHPRAVRAGAVVASCLLAALAVTVAGPVAFVAFVSGPIARRLRGRGPAPWTAVLVGAVVVVAADLLAQHAVPALLPGALQPPVGLITGALGAPFLLWLLVRGERRKEGPS